MTRYALMLLTPLLLSSGGDLTASRDAYKLIGTGDPTNPCYFNVGAARCPNDISKVQWLFKHFRKKQLGSVFESVTWGTYSPMIKRKAAFGNDSARLSIAPMASARRMFLKGNDGWLDVAVVAILTVDPTGPTDALFGIGGAATADFQNRFFLVSSKFSPTVDSTDGVSRRIGKWMIFGITKEGKLKKLPKEGSFRWCATGHDPADYPTGANFVRCPDDADLAKIAKRPEVRQELNGRLLLSAVTARVQATGEKNVRDALQAGRLLVGVSFTESETQTIEKALRDTYDAPAWLTCGVGCCVAEDF
jgi:hypothetical protein